MTGISVSSARGAVLSPPRAPLVLGAVGTVAVFVLAEILVRTLLKGDMPTPVAVSRELVAVVGEGGFWRSVGQTMQSWAIGLGLAMVVAVPLGILIGVSRTAFDSTKLPLEFVRPIPPIALLPVTVLVFGNTMSMKVSLILLGAVWPLLVQTIYGVRETDAVLLDTSKVYRFSRWQVMTRVVIPSALPFAFTGLRISSMIALILGFGAEYIVGVPGLGADTLIAYNAGDSTRTYALIAAVGVLGVVTSLLLQRLERRILHWHTMHRRQEA